jgi:caffeoyl-CoA O-methyltransferase
MEFLPENIEKYCQVHTLPETELLKKLNRETYAKVLMPRMLSGHLQGRFLAMISQMIQPKYILEIGTYTGYSALCLAEGLQANGKLITLDINEELEEFVRNFFLESDVNEKIDYRIGNALEIIPTLDFEWDLVFIDADKRNYLQYYEMVFPKVRKNGFILIDNVLWSGKVAQPIKDNDQDTILIDEFNKKVHQDERVENFLLPLRDGIMMLRKL